MRNRGVLDERGAFQAIGEEVDRMYDLLIHNGRILNGAADSWFRADIAIFGDSVVAMGPLGDREATRAPARNGG